MYSYEILIPLNFDLSYTNISVDIFKKATDVKYDYHKAPKRSYTRKIPLQFSVSYNNVCVLCAESTNLKKSMVFYTLLLPYSPRSTK